MNLYNIEDQKLVRKRLFIYVCRRCYNFSNFLENPKEGPFYVKKMLCLQFWGNLKYEVLIQCVESWGHKDSIFWVLSKSEMWNFFDVEVVIVISSTDVDQKSFFDQFLILYIIEVQKLPTSCLFNFVRVYQLLQPHLKSYTCLWKYHC